MATNDTEFDLEEIPAEFRAEADAVAADAERIAGIYDARSDDAGDAADGPDLGTTEGALGEVAELAAGAPDERREAFRESFDNSKEALGTFAVNQMTPEEYRTEVTDRLRGQLEDASVEMAVEQDTIRAVLGGDGRFKNQHEVGESNGIYDPQKRKALEAKKLGNDSDTDRDLPKYGFIRGPDGEGPSGAIQQYGDARVELSDDVRKRTTVTSGDSLEDPDSDPGKFTQLGVPLNDPSYEMMPGTVQDPLEKLEQNHVAEREFYAEAQIHGDLTLEDVERIRMPEPETLSDEQRQRLSDAGVELEAI